MAGGSGTNSGDSQPRKVANSTRRINIRRRFQSDTTLEMTSTPRTPGANVLLHSVRPNVRVEPLTTNFDKRSQKGHFGWSTVGSIQVPYIFRSTSYTNGDAVEDVRYVALRIVNQKAFPYFFSLFQQELFDLIPVATFGMTRYERDNYNDINFNHCDALYGLNPFQTDERLVQLEDAQLVFDFLFFMMNRHVYKTEMPNTNFGYMMFDRKNLVPYYKMDDNIYMPMYYFEGDERHLSQKLKMLPHLAECIVKVLITLQKVVVEASPIKFVNFNEIKQFFAASTLYEEAWLRGNSLAFVSGTSVPENSILRVINCDGLSACQVRYYNWYGPMRRTAVRRAARNPVQSGRRRCGIHAAAAITNGIAIATRNLGAADIATTSSMGGNSGPSGAIAESTTPGLSFSSRVASGCGMGSIFGIATPSGTVSTTGTASIARMSCTSAVAYSSVNAAAFASARAAAYASAKAAAFGTAKAFAYGSANPAASSTVISTTCTSPEVKESASENVTTSSSDNAKASSSSNGTD